MRYTNLLLSAFLVATTVSYSQNQSQKVRNRIEGTERPSANKQVSQASDKSKASSESPSDTGAQRPVILKKKGFSAFFGYDTKYFYRSNPLAQEGKLKQQATGMWTNTFYGGSGLGVYDMTDYVLTPYVGGSWTLNDYVESGLETFNYNSTGAYALLLAQFSNGWSCRAGVSYSNDRSTEFDTEDFKEFYPNLGIMKAYNISDNLSSVFDASIGRHNAETFSLGIAGTSEKELSNTEIAASYALTYNWESLILIPKYKISYKDYDKGINNGRTDTTHDLSLRADYLLGESLKLSAFYSYSNRNAKDAQLPSDYESYDAGVGLGINARF